ncbi:MAG: hypothetical protein WBA72_08415 [Ornithinimicrobium sp.]
MNSLAGCIEECDLPRRRGSGDVIYRQTGAPVSRPRLFLRITFVIDKHDAVVDLHFVGVRARRRLDLGEYGRSTWVTHVDDGGADTICTHMADIGNLVIHVDVHAVPVPSQVCGG